MAAKELTFDVDARQSLLAGVEKLARAVKATLGPRGRSGDQSRNARRNISDRRAAMATTCSGKRTHPVLPSCSNVAGYELTNFSPPPKMRVKR